MPMSPRLLRPRASGTAVHPEAVDWATRVTANGGTVTTNTLAAVSNFCSGIQTAGIRNKFWRLNLCCGDNFLASLVPLYRGPAPTGTQFGYATDAAINFVTGDYITTGSSTGLSIGPFGGQKFLVTGLAISDFYTSTTGLHLGCATSAVAAGGVFVGVNYGGGFANAVLVNNGVQSSSNNNGSIGNTAAHVARRFLNSNVTTTSNSVMSAGTAGGSFGILPTNNVPTGFISVMALSTSSTTASNFVNAQVNNLRVLLYSIGSTLTLSEHNAVDSLLSTFLTQIGRTT